MDFRVIASSSSGNAYVVSHGGSSLLLECGIRYADLQRALGHQVTALAGCLISHDHGDHARAAADVARAGVDVYASSGTLEEIGLTGHRSHIVTALGQVRIGPWTVLPWPAIHDAPEPYGFLVMDLDGDRLLFATDTAYVPYRFARLSIVAIEANWSSESIRRNVASGALAAPLARRIMRTHMSIERACGLLRANDLGCVHEVHLLHLSDQNSDAAEFRRAAMAASGRPVYAAVA